MSRVTSKNGVITIELSVKEATVLATVIGLVGGDPFETERVITDELREDLRTVGIVRDDELGDRTMGFLFFTRPKDEQGNWNPIDYLSAATCISAVNDIIEGRAREQLDKFDREAAADLLN